VKPGRIAGLARSLAGTASDVLGSDLLYIEGGDGVEAIQGDITRGNEYPDDVAEPESSLSLVILESDFLAAYPDPALSYIKKLCNFDGEEFRISSISERKKGFVTITLSDSEEGV